MTRTAAWPSRLPDAATQNPIDGPLCLGGGDDHSSRVLLENLVRL